MTTPGTPTQVAHPWRATARTVAAIAAALIPALAVAIPVIADELGPWLPDNWIAWLVGAAGFLTALAGAVTRIMAIPQVEALLSTVGLDTGVKREPTHRAEVDQ